MVHNRYRTFELLAECIMLFTIILSISCILAVFGVVLSLRIRKHSGRSPLPILIAVALAGAAAWHFMRLVSLYQGRAFPVSEFAGEVLVLLVFLCTDAGLLLVVPLFEKTQRANSKRRESEKRYRQLVEVAPFGIAVHRGGRGLYANPAAVRIFGEESPDVFIGADIMKYVHPEYRTHAEERMRLAGEEGQVTPLYETRYVRSDESTLHVETIAAPITFGGSRAVMTVFHDITERKRAEGLEEQLRASQKMEALGRLAGGVAHDFNNLLTAILGYGSLLRNKIPKGDPMSTNVDEIISAGKRAELLTRQLLAFSRRQVMEPTDLDLNAIVTDMETMFHRLIGEEIELTTQPAPDLGLVKADRGQMEQVIANLVINARDAMHKGGKLIIRTANADLDETTLPDKPDVPPGRYVMLAVSDTGSGMDEEVQSHLFEPFFTTKEIGKGTGLGLSTVYGIVQQSRGVINVLSEPGKGTTIEVFLQRSPVSKATPRTPIKEVPPKMGNETILLVEDEVAVRKLAREVLDSMGYRVLEASNGIEALSVSNAFDGPIQLLLTDVTMPGMNGRKLAARVIDERDDIRVLYISGYTDVDTKTLDMTEPEAGFLQKPFSPDGLARMVRRVLDWTRIIHEDS